MVTPDLSPDFRVCGGTLSPAELISQLAARGAPRPVRKSTGASRVLQRYFGPGDHELSDDVRAYAADLARSKCTPSTPDCVSCPLKYRCCEAASRLAPASDAPKAVDLFAGAGGMSLGLEQAGFQTVLAADHDPWFLATHQYNRPGGGTRYVLGDLADWRHEDECLNDVALLAGGVPCQPFSNANRQRRSIDPRRDLFRLFLDAAEAIKPATVLIENVGEFRHNHNAVEEHLSKIGYACAAIIIDSADFGVPQHRRRFFFLAYSRDAFSEADSRLRDAVDALADRTSHRTTLWDAIGDLPALQPNRKPNRPWAESDEIGYAAVAQPASLPPISSYVTTINSKRRIPVLFNHKARFNNDRDIEIFSRLGHGDDARAPQISGLMPYESRNHVFYDKYFRLWPNRPSKVITAHMRYDCNSYIHPYQPRGLTVREAARIQGFPDDYVFLGTFQRLYQQVGNAVPPPVARAIGDVLMADVRSVNAVA